MSITWFVDISIPSILIGRVEKPMDTAYTLIGRKIEKVCFLVSKKKKTPYISLYSS